MAVQKRNRFTVEKKLRRLCSVYSLYPLCEVIDMNSTNIIEIFLTPTLQ